MVIRINIVRSIPFFTTLCCRSDKSIKCILHCIFLRTFILCDFLQIFINEIVAIIAVRWRRGRLSMRWRGWGVIQWLLHFRGVLVILVMNGEFVSDWWEDVCLLGELYYLLACYNSWVKLELLTGVGVCDFFWCGVNGGGLLSWYVLRVVWI